MKRLLSVIVLLMILCASLCSCAKKPPAPCAHSDLDGDALCDACGEALPQKECQAHTDANEDLSCDACGAFVDEQVAGWLLEGVPTYGGGRPSGKLYLAGQGLAQQHLPEKENVLQVVSNTSAAEFEAYLAKLARAGFQRELARVADGNSFASFVKGRVRVYAYFMSRTGEARILREYTDVSASLSALAYTYEKKAGEQSVLYQFALPMNDATHPKPDFKDNGMLYLIKLADGAVVVIDGANANQISDERRDALMEMLWEITGKAQGDTVRIAAWYITHAHTDHYGGFVKFTWKYAKYLDLERVFYALPSLCSPDEVFAEGSGADGQRKIVEIVNEYYADDEPLFVRLHTGQSFSLADVTFEVLQTHEDLVDPVTGDTRISNYNDASTVLRVQADGQSFLFLGDAGGKVAMPQLMKNWSNDYLRCDGVQLSHHVMNDLTPLYAVVRASVLFVPQSRYGIERVENRVAIFEAAKSHAREDMVFLQSEGTVGIAVQNGRWEKVYDGPFAY